MNQPNRFSMPNEISGTELKGSFQMQVVEEEAFVISNENVKAEPDSNVQPALKSMKKEPTVSESI